MPAPPSPTDPAPPGALRFDNRFLRELPGDPEPRNFVRAVRGACWSAVAPTPVAAPRLLAVSRPLAGELGLDPDALAHPDWVATLAGNALRPGMAAYATRYGGHQFGHWAGQLGDGRAILLGELLAPDGRRWELQLKGAGPTPYARRADGRAVLRSSLREFLCSEAMHHLGIPTTRALALVATGEPVVRDPFYDGRPRPEPGAVVCRAAPSFLRFGHFEILAASGEHELLRRLADFARARDFPAPEVPASGDPLAAWFADICVRTARLVAQWMRVGFVHGVMNTDNMSLLGLTIDYGPYGWLEAFDPAWTPNTTDAAGRRYAFGRQPEVAHWNLARLAEALAPLVGDRAALDAGLDRYDTEYAAEIARHCLGKFGLGDWRPGDDALCNEAFAVFAAAALDYTDTFRRLADIDPAAPRVDALAPASHDAAAWAATRPALAAWLARWSARVSAQDPGQRRSTMNRHNPRFVLRNHLAQQAIEGAEAGDERLLGTLLDALQHPYAERPPGDPLTALCPAWARNLPGCSMLSCSS